MNYSKLYTLRSDGRYMGYWHDKDGTRHAVYDKDPARLYAKITDKENPSQTFADIINAWQAEHEQIISYKTAETYKAPIRAISAAFGSKQARDISSHEITAYLASLANANYSRRTVQMHRDILNMTFNYAIVHGLSTINPCSAVSMPRNLPYTPRELPSDAAIDAVKTTGLTHPFGLFAYTLLYTGMRRGEALALTYADVDRNKNIIRVNKSFEYLGNNPHVKSTKTRSGIREIDLLSPLAAALPQKETGYIFTMNDGAPLTKSSYTKKWRSYCKYIGHDITAHQLRHGYATLLYEAGIDDKDAQELLGHSNITLTRNVYTHIRAAHKKERADKLNKYIESRL